MELLLAIDALDDLVSSGRPLLVGSGRKVDAAAYDAAVARIGAAVAVTGPDPRLAGPLGTLEAVSTSGARKLRIDPSVVGDALDHLRLAVVEVIGDNRPDTLPPRDPAVEAALDALDVVEAVMHDGPVSGMSSTRRRVDEEALRAAVGQLGSTIEAAFDLLERQRLAPAQDAVSGLLDGRERRGRLTVDPERVYEALDALRRQIQSVERDRG